MAEQLVQPHQLGTGTRDGSHFLRDDGTWVIPSGSGGGSVSSGGGSGAIVPIQVIGPITVVQATLAFSSIPQTGFRNLRLVVQARGTTAAQSTNMSMQINGDGGANYNLQNHLAFGTSNTASSTTGQTSALIAAIAAASATASFNSIAEIRIPNYVGTSFFKEFTSHGFVASSTIQSETHDGWWASAAAVSSIALSLAAGNFDVGSYACLYGEMDTAGPLLTPASNLIQETVLSGTSANVSIPIIPQNYRDLRIVWRARGDTAATSVLLRMQINGDTTSVYDGEVAQGSNASLSATPSAAAASALIGEVSAASAPAGAFGHGTLTLPGFADAAVRKSWIGAYGYVVSDGVSTSVSTATSSGQWRNASPAAITSLLLFPASGNFAAGTTIRVYGEPVSAGGSAVGTGTRLRIGSNQSIATATATPIAWDAEDNDADNQHYISVASLTGTVAKSSGSNVLTGTSTLFTTELSVGQVVSVPGTAAEIAVVTSIASATSLTVATPFTNTATGQTAATVNSAVTFRQPGFYALELGVYSAALSTGGVTLAFRLNGSTIIGQSDVAGLNAASGYALTIQRSFQQWDYVEALWTQNSGGSVNVLTDERTHWSILARPTVIIAVPYVNIQDQKAQSTTGGTFTAGSWQTRTLNTKQSDTAGVAILASNQITLPPGTYRCHILVPGNTIGLHQARLQNITDSSTMLWGVSVGSQTNTTQTTYSAITGKFTISASKVFEIQHQCQSTGATNGFGSAAGFGTEVYTMAEFWKEG